MTNTAAADDGGPAFPGGVYAEGADRPYWDGMTLRDYFAAQALSAAVHRYFSEGDAWDGYDDLAGSVWRIADAMLRARGAK